MNDLPFVERAQTLLRSKGVETWVFGGWGEELRGLIKPRDHVDLDLLYPARDWTRVDALDLDWVKAKRLPWKRAFVLEGTLVELFRADRDKTGWFTQLQSVRHQWPVVPRARPLAHTRGSGPGYYGRDARPPARP